MSERIPNDQETIERAMLWSDLQELFQENAFTAGIQAQPGYPHFRLALIAKPDDEYIVQVWGRWTNDVGLDQATLIFLDKEEWERGKWIESYSYDVRELSIEQCSEGDEPTPLDREDIQDLRADLQEAEWDPEASAYYAANYMFWEPAPESKRATDREQSGEV